MSSFYNNSGQGNSSNSNGGGGDGGGNGFYNSGSSGYDYNNQFQQPPQQQQQQQQQQQPQQQQPGFNANQWQPSSSQNNAAVQQQQQPQPTQQPPQLSATPAFWNPSTAASIAGLAAQAASGGISNDTVLDWAVKGGSKAWQSGGASMIPGFDTTMQNLRAYFAVDNRYVQLKMQKVLFPFLSKQWKRMQTEGPEMVNYALPNSDENAPDLYLPLMSLITYCLLCALCYGTAGQFNPEVIADVTTKCFGTQILEVLVIRFGFYMMQAPVPFLDLFSYTGYKYLGLTCSMLFGLGFGHLGYGTSGFYVTFLYTASAASYFMLKTMANNIPTETAAAGPKREAVILAFAVSQAVSMWFVSQTKFL